MGCPAEPSEYFSYRTGRIHSGSQTSTILDHLLYLLLPSHNCYATASFVRQILHSLFSVRFLSEILHRRVLLKDQVCAHAV